MKSKEKQPPIKGFSGSHRFLSNFWATFITYEGIKYPSVEHAFQAAKTKDTKKRERISWANTPGQAKDLGKRLTPRDDWTPTLRVEIMTELLQLKFSDPQLRHQLLRTDHAYLEETNNWNDTFWGVCDGIGHNHLGEILMGIRKQIQGPKRPKRFKHEFPS